MGKRFYNGIIGFNQRIIVRNEYNTNIIYSCSLLDSISNKIITVTEITLWYSVFWHRYFICRRCFEWITVLHYKIYWIN